MLEVIPGPTYCDITITLCGLFDHVEDLPCDHESSQLYKNHGQQPGVMSTEVQSYISNLSDAAIELL